ncbi:hypothetical protein K8T06_04140, partial [bacterium]|nr:hypothetical protein [bacterium]
TMDPDLADPQCIHNGDVNCDGTVTAEDAQNAFQAALGLYPISALESCRADCNNDDSITAADAQTIFMKVMGTGDCFD